MARFVDNSWPHLRAALLYGAARALALSAAGHFLAPPLMLGDRDGIQILSPVQAVLTAALLLTDRSRWPSILAVNLIFSLAGWRAPGHVIPVHELVEAVQSLVTASLWKAFARTPPRLDHLRDVGWFVLFAVIAGPVAANALLRVDEWGQRILNNAVTSLTLVTAFMVWGAIGIERMAASLWPRRVEALLLSLSLVGVTFWVYAKPVANAANLMPSLVLPVPLLLWAAVRFDPRAITAALLVMSVTALYFSTAGEGPFAHFSPIGNIRSLQLFLSVLALSTLSLAAVVQERHRARQRLESRLRLEEYLSGLSHHLYSSGATDSSVRSWIFALLDVLDVDRVSLIERRTNPHDTYLEFAFARGGLPAPRPIASRSDFSWISRRLSEVPALVLNKLPDDLPVEAANERGFFTNNKIKSYLAIPVQLDASTRWTLSVTAVRHPRVWTDEIVAQLRLVGETVAMAVARRRAAEALSQSESQFRALFDEAPLGIAVTDARGTIRRSNRALREMLGFSEEELRAQPLTSLVDGDAPEFLVTPGGQELLHEAWYSTKEGRRWFRLRASAIPGENGQHELVIAMIEDLTERKAAENKVRSLTGQLISAQEEERRRLSRELHDDVNQQIAAASILLSGMKRYLPEEQAEAREQFARIQSQLIAVSGAIRALSHGLHSAVLEHTGLVSALRGVCIEFEKTHGIRCSFELEPVDAEPPPEVSLCLYRVLQESLRNVAKHSGSTEVEVWLTSEHGWLKMSVSDRGTGFDLKLARKGDGLGLVSMEERVRALGGEFDVGPRRDGPGTVMWVRIDGMARAQRAAG